MVDQEGGVGQGIYEDDFWSSVGGLFGDYGEAAAVGAGGLLGLFGGSGGSSDQVTGYQGGIPQYTASREYYGPQEGRRPGSEGRKYFSDVAFTPVETEAAAATSPAPQQGVVASGVDLDRFSGSGEAYARGGRIPRYAAGGLGALGGYSDGGQMLKGPGTGQSDDIPATIEGEQPARLARDEFVIPADVVSILGDGSSDAGAERLYAMMDRIRKAANGDTKQQSKINPNQVLPA